MLLEAPATSMLSATSSTSASKTTASTRNPLSTSSPTEATPEADSDALVPVPPSSSLTVVAPSKRVSKKKELVRVSKLNLHEQLHFREANENDLRLDPRSLHHRGREACPGGEKSCREESCCRRRGGEDMLATCSSFEWNCVPLDCTVRSRLALIT
ncbi:hypothetical protein AHAS_Ahas01G0213900 [Arachis hypogaea]